MGIRAHTVPKFYLQGFTASKSDEHLNSFVWLGSLKTGEIIKRSPKNISTVRSAYDGVGAFADPNVSIETHLSKIESRASIAIRKYTSRGSNENAVVPNEIWRFLAWQAARTPGWMELVQKWANEPPFGEGKPVEPPPPGLDKSISRVRALWLEEPETGERIALTNPDELDLYLQRGWKLLFGRDDHLEMMHIQAWYFQVRHFPRLSWTRLEAPKDEYFVTSDRGVAWLVDGYADTPPAALRHPTAQVVAPLTKKFSLVGRHETNRLNVTPREVNRFIAFAASNWIAGPTIEIVQQALIDSQHHWQS
jgi:hypothetical protein